MEGKRVLTDEIRRKLERLLPFAPDSHVRFTPDIFDGVPPEYRPVFLMAPVGSEELKEFVKAVQKPDANIFSLYAETLAKSAVKGCENYREAANPEDIVPFTVDKLKSFPFGLLTALWEFASELANGPKKEEREGLESSPPSTSEPSSAVADGAAVTPA